MKTTKQRWSLWLLVMVWACACDSPSQDTDTQAETISTSIEQFDWLLGEWQRTNDDPGKETFEQWQKLDSTHYQGLGFTMQAGDTVFKEDLRLVQREQQWYFEVRGVNEKPTLFPLTQMDPLSFQCENPENEFPKIIQYEIEGVQLKAVISDGKTEIPFYFDKLLGD
ncbi:MAG: DUF6265 family protein [Bacteroidota bacterium]